MRDREHAEVVLRRHRLDAARDVAQRIDVEPGVDLVEDGKARLQDRELERLHALLLAARELVVDATGEELVGDGEALCLVTETCVEPVAPFLARTAASTRSPTFTPGTSTGYCMARNSPCAARCHVGSPSSSTPSIVTDPRVTS